MTDNRKTIEDNYRAFYLKMGEVFFEEFCECVKTDDAINQARHDLSGYLNYYLGPITEFKDEIQFIQKLIENWDYIYDINDWRDVIPGYQLQDIAAIKVRSDRLGLNTKKDLIHRECHDYLKGQLALRNQQRKTNE